jgi:hypothetical protein
MVGRDSEAEGVGAWLGKNDEGDAVLVFVRMAGGLLGLCAVDEREGVFVQRGGECASRRGV